MEVIDEPRGFVLRLVPHMDDWAGADAGKHTYSEMTETEPAEKEIALIPGDTRRMGQRLRSSSLV